LCCIVAAALSTLAVAYTGSAVNQRSEVQQLRKDNIQLSEVNRQLEQTISDVQGRLDDFEERTSRLALAAGMATDAEGLGGQPRSGDRVGSGGPYDRLPGSPKTLELQGDWIKTQLELVEERLDKRGQVLSSTPTTAPVLGLITDGFGMRPDPFTGRMAVHRGLDISARRKTRVLSPADGIVVSAGRNGGLGKVVRVSHGFGYTTVYGHLDKMSVQPGDEVRRGDELGLLGSSGRSTGPHLHYEVHVDGRAVNPLYYILNAY
jgi:murein DD-endopeptidase MepM/ murein hydrolase activator NlpD